MEKWLDRIVRKGNFFINNCNLFIEICLQLKKSCFCDLNNSLNISVAYVSEWIFGLKVSNDTFFHELSARTSGFFIKNQKVVLNEGGNTVRPPMSYAPANVIIMTLAGAYDV